MGSLKQASNATTFKLNTQKSSFIIVLYQFKQTLNSSERGSRELSNYTSAKTVKS